MIKLADLINIVCRQSSDPKYYLIYLLLWSQLNNSKLIYV